MVLPSLVCPPHHLPLQQGEEKEACCAQGCRVRVCKGLWRFAPNGYASAFGLQWRAFRTTQLDSHVGAPFSEQRLRRCLGEDLWLNLKNSAVLELGCGAGRFTEVLLKEGASVASVDLSDAVDANQENFPQSPRHLIAQADVNALPFSPQQFDIVLCLGVIQHTPSSEGTIAKLWEQVKPGGALVIDHYTYNLSYFTKTAPLFRLVLKELPPELGLKVTSALVRLLFPLHKAVRNLYPLQMLLSRLSPVQVYFRSLPQLSMEQQREWALLDTHDTLTDWYKRFRTRAQIEKILINLGAQRIWCAKGGNGVEARAFRHL